MNHSGDAAEQIVRMSLEGVEVAARITGAAAKEIAVLLLAALKSPEKSDAGGLKLKGKARLESMLKSGKPLEIFSVREGNLRTFAQEAKRYGIVYCVLRNGKNTPDGLCDIMVRASDAPKINRLVERFKFAAVEEAEIENGIAADRAGRAIIPAGPAWPGTEPGYREAVVPSTGAVPEALSIGAGPETAEINDIDKLLDELLGTDYGKTAPEKTEAEKVAAGKVVHDTSGPGKITPEKTEPGKAAPEKVESGKTMPEKNEHEKPMSEKVEPGKAALEKVEPVKAAPRKSGRGHKREPIPAAGAPMGPAQAADWRKETGPLASGGRNPADSPAYKPAYNLGADRPPPKTNPSETSSVSRKSSLGNSEAK